MLPRLPHQWQPHRMRRKNHPPRAPCQFTIEDDLAFRWWMASDRFLLSQIAADAASRAEPFTVDTSSVEAYRGISQAHREEAGEVPGIRDAHLPFTGPEVIAAVGANSVIASSEKFTVQAIRWPVLSSPSPQGQGLPSIYGEGLLLTPKGEIIANAIVLTDARPETPGTVLRFGRGDCRGIAGRASSCGIRLRVVVPALISRHREKRLGRADLTNREYLHASRL